MWLEESCYDSIIFLIFTRCVSVLQARRGLDLCEILRGEQHQILVTTFPVKVSLSLQTRTFTCLLVPLVTLSRRLLRQCTYCLRQFNAMEMNLFQLLWEDFDNVHHCYLRKSLWFDDRHVVAGVIQFADLFPSLSCSGPWFFSEIWYSVLERHIFRIFLSLLDLPVIGHNTCVVLLSLNLILSEVTWWLRHFPAGFSAWLKAEDLSLFEKKSKEFSEQVR